jgi:predicted transposase/invertase (TIGR01784 family)
MAELTNPHDRFFKDLLAHPEAARDFLIHYLPANVVALLEFSDFELAKNSFVDVELREYFSDLLFKVRTKAQTDVYIFILFDHKSHPAATVAFQLLRYMVRIWEQQLREQGSLWPILPMVVYHGKEAWTAARNLQSLFELPEALRVYTPEYRYALCDLSTYSDEQLKGELLLQVGLLALKYIFRPELLDRLPALLGMLRELLRQETAIEYIQTVLRYLTKATDRITEDDLRTVMRDVFPEGEAMMGTIAEKWIEQGIQKGLELGRQEGLEQGLERGRRQGLLDGIELALELRFGADGLRLVPEIAEVEDANVLRAIHTSIRQVTSPDELRRIYRKT